jgi:hypothetical protein
VPNKVRAYIYRLRVGGVAGTGHDVVKGHIGVLDCTYLLSPIHQAARQPQATSSPTVLTWLAYDMNILVRLSCPVGIPDRADTQDTLFGRTVTPAERLRQHQRSLQKAQRELERERSKLEQQEKRTMADIKKNAKAGNMVSCAYPREGAMLCRLT